MPVSDAKAVAKTLRGLGFAVIEEHNVTRDELLEAVAEFRAKLRGAEVALFYYAGHGISVAGSNYLIPVKSGYKPEGADDTTLRLLAETKLFNAEQVVAEMSAAGARCNLVILDACRSTPVARNPRTRDVANPGGLCRDETARRIAHRLCHRCRAHRAGWRWCQRPLHRGVAQTPAHPRPHHRAGFQAHPGRRHATLRWRANSRRIFPARRRGYLSGGSRAGRRRPPPAIANTPSGGVRAAR